ncbi:MAG: FKBP-type peptidyl-prolyl cis-trans isomerase [Thaumarchaeota archaeon]|nr:FKBP-type peptidyl-prolyl cis-trans isomerase [Nitrososphaerota archaeon]
MPLEAGSFILANYTAKEKDTGEPVETTLAEEAKKLGIHDPTREYEPRLVAVGEGWVLQGVDEALKNANVGDKLTVEVPPEKGFGQRDASRVRLIPIRKFGDKADELRIGDVVEIEGRVGTVRFIGSGRAQVDFNHRFAGKVLVYDLEVVKKLETEQDKTIALIKRRIPVEENEAKLSFEEPALRIELPQKTYLAEGIQIIKRALSSDIFKYLLKIKTVTFLETYEAPKPQETVEAKPAQTAEEPAQTPEEPPAKPEETAAKT